MYEELSVEQRNGSDATFEFNVNCVSEGKQSTVWRNIAQFTYFEEALRLEFPHLIVPIFKDDEGILDSFKSYFSNKETI